ncbi:MAG: OmpA family protein, partial [Sorangiineae bacterium]|nr:OmpA family protein [Sorangiineae bacterium]
LLRLHDAGSAAPGTFRMSFISSYFSGSGFLCDGSSTSCPSPTGGKRESDSVSQIGAHLGLSATILPFFEAYAGLHSRATSNDQGRPQLLQVLGDSNLGVKFFLPYAPDRIFNVGGEAELWLLNGTGSVGLDGSGTSVALRALGTVDFNNRTDPAKRVPLKLDVNFGYLFDRSGNLVEDVEAQRGKAAGIDRLPISRIERFGLAINRVDSMRIGLGAEGMFSVLRPFVEWTIDVPVNRQGYTCNATRAATVGDGCLGNDAGFGTSPSRITLGARAMPWQGLGLLAAVDIGTGATSSFIEEVAPQAPWTLYLGVGFAVDTVPPKPVIKEVASAAPPPPAAPPEYFIEGSVVDKTSGEAIPNAILRYDGRALTGMVAGPDGKFRTANLAPGAYTLSVTADGYRDAQCSATITAASPGGYGYAPYGQPGMAQPGMGQPGMAQPGMAPPPGGAPSTGSPTVTTIQCQLEALPKVGNVVGQVVDSEGGAPVGNAKIKIADKLGRELELQADASGAFRFENVPPGQVTLTVTADGYLLSVTQLEVRAREDMKASISLNKRPARPSVTVTFNELKLAKQIHFQHNSAAILPDSMGVLEELADVLRSHPELQKVEIQGHTDNTGSAPYNLRLSQERADAVRSTLMSLGVDGMRLAAKGYGQDKPIAPNNTDANRAKNRRVQIIILEKAKK